MGTTTKGVTPKATTQGTDPTKKQSIDDLMKAAFALTHKIHALDKIKTQYMLGTPDRDLVESDVDDLRAARDMIVREVKRRAGEL